MTKSVYFSIGCIAFSLGALGMFLPLLPTTCFWLLAAWAFSKSSERFYQKLVNHHTFGPVYRNWQRDKSVPANVKLFALSSIVISLALTTHILQGQTMLQTVAIVSMVLVATFLISLPVTRQELVAQKI